MKRSVVITGTTHGIGQVTARELVRQGWHVVMLVRDPAAGVSLAQAWRTQTPDARIEVIACDLASQASVRAAADEVARRCPVIDRLIHNAGRVALRHERSVDGHEIVFATNHLGPFLLTERLRPLLREHGGRVVLVASCAHAWATLDLGAVIDPAPRRWRAQASYAQSKLANVLHAQALARQLAPRGIGVFSLHPGVVHTHLLPGWLRRLKPLVSRGMFDAERGARSTLHAALDPMLDGRTGLYIDEHQQIVSPSPLALDIGLQEALWRASARWTAEPDRSDPSWPA